MNATALLGRLKASPRSLWPRRGSGGARPRAAAGRRPAAVALAYAALLLALAGGAGWLAVRGDGAAEAWRSAIPHITVAVDGGAAPAAAPTPAAAAHAAPDHAAPPPAPAPHAAGADTSGHDASGHREAAAAPVAPAPAPAAAAIAATAPDARVTMAPAPASGLVEETRAGPLPRIAGNGRRPWQVYARPFPADDPRPRIALILSDMGLSGVTTGNALQNLPGAVTLAFVPFGERLDTWIEKARGDGHEVMLSLPMEPEGFPRNDPGPNALLTGLSADRNQERLLWSLAKAVGYVGVTSSSGGKFTASADAMRPLVDTLKARGLLYVDPGTAPRSKGPELAAEAGVPRARIDRVIDRDLSRGAIDDQLKELERIAKAQGAAIGIGFPYPSTIERIKLWATGLQDRGIVLAPVSAVVNMQKGLGG
ncbi:divergent polysaccharide deacetylase family protein [Azospirillum sp. ST 5-10]|uniref:divergent polysaccharide deacetylase family protein n=1 Tax=unclassified Azospirillum TaxID=2630922 RepID=UPI003F4A3DD7